MIAASFLGFLCLFALVGIASYRRARPSAGDYLLAGQAVKPWLVGLSAVATNNSGYMFIGVIGYTYATGLPAIWLMVGWITGDLVASQFIHRRLRSHTGNRAGHTFASVLSRWNGTDFRWYRRIAGCLSIVFLGTYAAAQLTAGSKALTVLFGWDYYVGAVLGSAIVVAYCLAGGIRASIWTDAAQSFVMLVAMAVMLFVCVTTLGGPVSTLDALQAVSPTFMDPLPHGLGLGDTWGPTLFIVGWVFAGFSVVGQPHIMVRFMSLDDPRHTNRARAYYYAWFVTFYFMANAVGLISRVLLPESANFDAELALPTLALELLPPTLVGLVLAGVFAATMSTADSLVLSCAASFTEDLGPSSPTPLWQVKLATLAVTVLALGIALLGNQSVFNLVIVSWSVLAAAFGPLLAVYAAGERPSEGLAIAMMLVGVAAVYGWGQVELLGDYYEGMLAIILGLITYLIGRGLGFTLPAGRPEIASVATT